MPRPRRMHSLAAISATGLLVLIYGCGQEPTEPAGLVAAGERYHLTIGLGAARPAAWSPRTGAASTAR